MEVFEKQDGVGGVPYWSDKIWKRI